MPEVDLLIQHAAQLVTCASSVPKRGAAMRDVGLIADGAVAINDGRIIAVGTTENISASYQSDNTVDASGKVVCPAFVDPHTHLVYAGNRLNEFEMRIQGKTYMEIMAAGGGIASTMRETRAASFDDLFAQSKARLDTMLRLGTTTAEIKTGYGLDTPSEVKMFNVIDALAQQHPMTIVPTFLGAHAIPPEFKDSADYLTRGVIRNMLPAIQRAYLPSYVSTVEFFPLFIDIFCEEGVFNLEDSYNFLEIGQNVHGMPVKAHVDEFVNLGGVKMAVDMKAVSVDHLDVTPDDELEYLAKSETVGVMLPAVNFNLGSSHYGNARKLIDSGGIFALATDLNPGSAPCYSMPMVMAIACRYQKLLPSEAMNASTINAAHAIRLANRVGSIEVGKQADILIINTDDYRDIAYQFGVNLVTSVFKQGQRVI